MPEQAAAPSAAAVPAGGIGEREAGPPAELDESFRSAASSAAQPQGPQEAVVPAPATPVQEASGPASPPLPTAQATPSASAGSTSAGEGTRPPICCSMVTALLQVYNAFWIFTANIIFFALGVNLLLSWFVEWFQSSAESPAGSNLEALSALKYFALLLRCSLLFRFLSHWFRVAIWLMQDAWDVKGFANYRGAAKRLLCRCCFTMPVQAPEDLNANVNANQACGTVWLDRLDTMCRMIIYVSLDLVPLIIGGITLYHKDILEAWTMMTTYACCIAGSHVLIFYFLEWLDDVVTKFKSLCKADEESQEALRDRCATEGTAGSAAGGTDRCCWDTASRVDRWANVYCGFEEENGAALYSLHYTLSALQILLFWYVNWVGGISLMAVVMALQIMRWASIGLVKPFGGLTGFLEAICILVTAFVLNWLYYSFEQAVWIIALGVSLQSTLNRHHKRAWRLFLWNSFVWWLVFFLIVSASMTALSQKQEDYSNFCKRGDTSCRYFRTGNISTTHPLNSDKYCSMRFFLKSNRSFAAPSLRLPDFAMFSSLAYEADKSFQDSLGRWFPGWRLVCKRRVDRVSSTHPVQCLNSTDQWEANTPDDSKDDLYRDWTTFFELADTGSNTTVFAIRGTQSPLEILQDINIWAPIAVPQLASQIGPDVASVAARAVVSLSTKIFGESFKKNYYSVLLAHVKDRMLADPNRQYYITGHSLGGGLAQLVSMETSITSVTFSAPGVKDTKTLFAPNKTFEDIESSTLQSMSYVVVPDNDVVPKVDRQLASEISIRCNRHFLQCHSIGETLCELLATCGTVGRFVNESVDVNCGLCPGHQNKIEGCQVPKPIAKHGHRGTIIGSSVFHV